MADQSSYPSNAGLKMILRERNAHVLEYLDSELNGPGTARCGIAVVNSIDELQGRLQQEEDIDLIVFDSGDRRLDGEFFSSLKQTIGLPVVLLLSGEEAVSAAGQGGPAGMENERLKTDIAVRQVRRKIKLNQSNGYSVGPMVGNSAPMQELRDSISEVATTNATVLILGENGTGKELVATEIHHQSRRAAGSFVPVDVGAIPENLLESILFGHEKGSFTGAHANSEGACAAANGGTLFLDEIGDLALGLQPKLLRFIQHGVVQKVGSPTAKPVDCRVVAATNRDLEEMVKQAEFRQDLFYRLNVFPIFVPSLRERSEDIPDLAQAFLSRFAARHERPAQSFTPAAIEFMVEYAWPGNIRELENLVERTVIRCRTEEIHIDMLLPQLAGRPAKTPGDAAPHVEGEYSANISDISEIERTHVAAIISALCKADGHVAKAAKHLGLGQATVYRKMKKYNIKRNSQSSDRTMLR